MFDENQVWRINKEKKSGKLVSLEYFQSSEIARDFMSLRNQRFSFFHVTEKEEEESKSSQSKIKRRVFWIPFQIKNFPQRFTLFLSLLNLLLSCRQWNEQWLHKINTAEQDAQWSINWGPVLLTIEWKVREAKGRNKAWRREGQKGRDRKTSEAKREKGRKRKLGRKLFRRFSYIPCMLRRWGWEQESKADVLAMAVIDESRADDLVIAVSYIPCMLRRWVWEGKSRSDVFVMAVDEMKWEEERRTFLWKKDRKNKGRRNPIEESEAALSVWRRRRREGSIGWEDVWAEKMRDKEHTESKSRESQL